MNGGKLCAGCGKLASICGARMIGIAIKLAVGAIHRIALLLPRVRYIAGGAFEIATGSLPKSPSSHPW